MRFYLINLFFSPQLLSHTHTQTKHTHTDTHTNTHTNTPANKSSNADIQALKERGRHRDSMQHVGGWLGGLRSANPGGEECSRGPTSMNAPPHNQRARPTPVIHVHTNTRKLSTNT